MANEASAFFRRALSFEEVLDREPERTRRFLLATSILERLNASLCDAALLDFLEKRDLFVVALDDRRDRYRNHHLFADVLQAHATREDRPREGNPACAFELLPRR